MSIRLNPVSIESPGSPEGKARPPFSGGAPKLSRYSLRRLNPLRSPIHVIHGQEVRAWSLDGLKWELQVRGEPPDGLWGGSRGGERVFFRFGHWSPGTGLRQVPINPILNTGELLPRAEQLLAELTLNWDRLPFPGIDVWELWLLGADAGHPLALLRTQALGPEPNPDPGAELPGWRAGAEDRPAADQSLFQEVETLFRRLAGDAPRVAWLGPTDVRPELPWRLDWPESSAAALMGSYLSRQAPRLLALPGIGDELRARLEREARHQALEVAALWRLYPKVLDPGFLNAARVEARIRASSSD